jgi:hypothetical protein
MTFSQKYVKCFYYVPPIIHTYSPSPLLLVPFLFPKYSLFYVHVFFSWSKLIIQRSFIVIVPYIYIIHFDQIHPITLS